MKRGLVDRIDKDKEGGRGPGALVAGQQAIHSKILFVNNMCCPRCLLHAMCVGRWGEVTVEGVAKKVHVEDAQPHTLR
jgi:hypothetical protein